MPNAIRRLAAVLELRPHEEGEEGSTAFEVNMKTVFIPRERHCRYILFVLQRKKLRIGSVCQPWTPANDDFIMPMRQIAERMMLPADKAA
jgi:hypothetical protein